MFEQGNANGAPVSKTKLPPALLGTCGAISGGTSIPAAHVAQNGAFVEHDSTGAGMACFYATNLVCYHTAEQRWHQFAVSAPHNGGQIVALGKSILVAGGFDPSSRTATTTDIVDVITFHTF